MYKYTTTSKVYVIDIRGGSRMIINLSLGRDVSENYATTPPNH